MKDRNTKKKPVMITLYFEEMKKKLFITIYFIPKLNYQIINHKTNKKGTKVIWVQTCRVRK